MSKELPDALIPNTEVYGFIAKCPQCKKYMRPQRADILGLNSKPQIRLIEWACGNGVCGGGMVTLHPTMPPADSGAGEGGA